MIIRVLIDLGANFVCCPEIAEFCAPDRLLSSYPTDSFEWLPPNPSNWLAQETVLTASAFTTYGTSDAKAKHNHFQLVRGNKTVEFYEEQEAKRV